MKLNSIGIWSEIKLDIIREYAHAYTTIMKKQTWCRGCIYIDAFAGPGMHLSRATGLMVPGSPLNILQIDNPFSECHYIDIDKNKAENLRKLTEDQKNIKVYEGDCNEILLREIFPTLPYESKKRALCILDPYGLHLHWETIMEAANLKTTEIFLNFPLMDMNRNVLHKDLISADPEQVERMNRFCGTEEWQEILYRKQPSFLGDEYEKKTKIGDNDALGKWFKEKRLKEIAGFKFVPEPILMKNAVGGQLYFLFFASHNETGKRIVNQIFDKYRKKLS